MARVEIVVRELRSSKPEYSLVFELPEVPAVGSYISVNRPDTPQPYGEDLIVRRVWWRLHHPETGGYGYGANPKVGALTEIIVECDQALGPWSSDRWRDQLEQAKARGVEVEEFDVRRLSIRQSNLPRAED